MKIELDLDAEEWDALLIAVEEWVDVCQDMSGEKGEPEWGEEYPAFRLDKKLNEVNETIKEVVQHGILDNIRKRQQVQAD